MVYIPAQDTYAKAQVAIQKGRELADVAKAQDLEQSRVKLDEADVAIQDVQDSLEKLAWTANVPILGDYYRDGEARSCSRRRIC